VVFLRRPTLARLSACFLVTGALLAFLLVDCRARELWLKPIDAGQIRYYLGNASDLASGMELFFLRDAGLGITFRRLLVVAAVAQVIVWIFAAIALRHRWDGGDAFTLDRRKFLAGAAVATLLPLGISVVVPHYRYSIEHNAVAGLVVAPLRSARATPQQMEEAARAFAQKARPLPEALAPPRRRATGAAAFRNVVLVLLESWRWKGHELGGEGDGATPVLRRLAREGLFGICHVSVPHSCKSQFTTITGRHPFLGLEIREGMRERYASLFWLLKERLGARTVCFSTQNLAFENLDGILKSCGVDERFGPESLAPADADPQAKSSFGSDDAALAEAPAARLAEASGRGPFAALLLTVDSHYPYVFPGKKESDGNGLESYERSVRRTDEIVGSIVEGFARRRLLDDTLFVLLGDHGESFGEHGSLIHNNSLYEEEMTVPLVFWSADGRLKDPRPLDAAQVDVAPTVADLCGASDPGYGVQGRSLLREGDGGRDYFMASFFDDVSCARLLGNEKIIYWPGSRQARRFDLAADPGEEHGATLEGAELERQVAPLEAFKAYQAIEFGR
jgi:sulfatase-like protein